MRKQDFLLTIVVALVITQVPASADQNTVKALSLRNLGADAINRCDWKAALELFQRSEKLNPDDAFTVGCIGRVLSGLDRKHEAIAYFKRSFQMQPKCYDPYIYLDYGDALVLENNLPAAIAIWTQGIKINPKTDCLYTERGLTYGMLKRCDLAAADLSQAISNKPTNTRLYQERGKIYMASKKYDKAVKDYSDVIRMAPSNPIAYTERAKAFAAMGNTELSQMDFQKARDIGF